MEIKIGRGTLIEIENELDIDNEAEFTIINDDLFCSAFLSAENIDKVIKHLTRLKNLIPKS